MPKTISAALLLTLLPLAASSGRAEALTDAPPANGPWKGRPAGTFIVERVTSASPGQPPQSKFQRTIFLGVTADGRPFFSVANADKPNGPWTESFGHGDAKTEFPIIATPLGRRTLDIAGRSVGCEVTATEMTTESSVITTETWTDDAGVIVKQTSVARSRDEDKPPVTSIDWSADGFEQRTLDGAPVEGVRVRGVSRFGNSTSTHLEVRSARVPGGRLLTRRWDGVDTTGAPTYETEVVSTGSDPAAAAAVRSRQSPPSMTEVQFRDRILETALADATSPDAAARARGIGTLAMNRYADDDRPRIIAAIMSGFADADPGVRRAAARAAGWNRVPDAAKHILAAAAAEPSKEASQRTEFIQALGDAADPAGLDTVIAAARDGSQPVAEIGFIALVQFTDPRAVVVAENVLRRAEPLRRSILLMRMDRARMPGTVDLLIKLTNDPDARTRAAALQCLAGRTEPAGAAVALRLRDDPDANARRAAIMALAACGWQEPVRPADALAALAADGPTADRTLAVLGLVNLKDDRAVPLLRRMIDAPQNAERGDLFTMTPSRELGFSGLSRLGTPAAAEALIDLVRDPARTDKALRALGDMESPAAARAAWTYARRQVADGGPTTQRSERGFSVWDTFLQIVIRRADRTLRDEIEAAIATAPPAQRPGLRRAVREIDARLAGGRPD